MKLILRLGNFALEKLWYLNKPPVWIFSDIKIFVNSYKNQIANDV